MSNASASWLSLGIGQFSWLEFLQPKAKGIVISRMACHRSALETPQQVNYSYLGLGRAHGYCRISALAGIDGNCGTCYAAVGFDLEDDKTDYVDSDGDCWRRRRYVYHLDSNKYDAQEVSPLDEDGGHLDWFV